MRLTLARPFFASGLTRWDGWFNLSFGTKILFEQEYKLHFFGAEIPFPMPDMVAAMASTAEIVLPILVAFGFLTRWAALGLLCMTAVIQLTYPDAWADYPPVLGGDGARDHDLRPGRGVARPAARPRRRVAGAPGLLAGDANFCRNVPHHLSQLAGTDLEEEAVQLDMFRDCRARAKQLRHHG